MIIHKKTDFCEPCTLPKSADAFYHHQIVVLPSLDAKCRLGAVGSGFSTGVGDTSQMLVDSESTFAKLNGS
jgi:hypothetical protein